jgi:hypothetical protein
MERLASLAVDAGYNSHDFIERLSRVALPNLRFFAWGEYAETCRGGWMNDTTPFSGMVKLFQSSAFDTLRGFALKNPVYSDEELRQLAGLRPRLQFKSVRTSSAYCR